MRRDLHDKQQEGQKKELIVMAVELRILSRGTRGEREQIANLIESISFGYAHLLRIIMEDMRDPHMTR
jgi:hypothetical protein